MASIDKRMMIKTLKQFLQPYVGAKADNFDIYRVLSNGDELELKRMYETLNLYDDDCDFRVKLSCPLKNGEYRLRVYQFVPEDSKPVKFIYETVLALGMSVSQLKQAVLNDLAEKQVVNNVPLNRSVFLLN